jgi:hypothetical protein
MLAMTYRAFIMVIAFVAMGISTAQADDPRRGGGFLELVLGPTLVQGDDDYENVVDDSFKLGLRGGSMGRSAGIEIGIDWNDLDPPDVPLLDTYFEAHRFRFLIGGRGGAYFGRVQVFGRLAIGADYVTASVDSPLGDNEESDLGFALELGGGAVFHLGGFYLGGQIAIPMAFHSEDDDEDNEDLGLDYTSTEIDLLLTGGLRF